MGLLTDAKFNSAIISQLLIDECGWKISKEQINKLQAKGIKKVISALDSDECGQKGTIYLSEYFSVKRIKYPDGIKDVGEMDSKMINKLLNEIDYIE